MYIHTRNDSTNLGSSMNTNDGNDIQDSNMATDNLSQQGPSVWARYIDPSLLDPATFGHGASMENTEHDENMADAPHEIDYAPSPHTDFIIYTSSSDRLSANNTSTSSALPSHDNVSLFAVRDSNNDLTPNSGSRWPSALVLQTPPMSQPSQQRLNAEARSFQPSSNWPSPTHGDTQVTRCLSIGSVNTNEPYGGYLTPTSAASAQRRFSAFYDCAVLPTAEPRSPLQQPYTDSRPPPLIHNESTLRTKILAPSANFYGPQAGIAPVDDMRSWIVGGPFTPNNIFPSVDHLALPLPESPGRSRAGSQGSRGSRGSYACTKHDCPRTFATKAERDHHQRYHGNRDHTCGVCGKGFHFPKDLRRHAKIHDP